LDGSSTHEVDSGSGDNLNGWNFLKLAHGLGFKIF
jgi:hypothetical protein